jgi:hypothetical protein
VQNFNYRFNREPLAATPTLPKDELDFSAQLSKTRSATTFESDKFQFLPSRSPRPFANTTVKFQIATLETRSATTSNNDNLRKTPIVCQRDSCRLANPKRPTTELMWGETEYT